MMSKTAMLMHLLQGCGSELYLFLHERGRMDLFVGVLGH